MWTNAIIAILFLTVIERGLAQSILHRKTEWTVSEVKEWAVKQKETSTWHGLLLYQGSDSLTHHFISRVMDEWVWINIKRTELEIAEEKIYSKTSLSPLGYYYVDGTNGFIKTKDYQKSDND
jgi:hypothetical protein